MVSLTATHSPFERLSALSSLSSRKRLKEASHSSNQAGTRVNASLASASPESSRASIWQPMARKSRRCIIHSYREERVRATALGRETNAVDWLKLADEPVVVKVLWLVVFVTAVAGCP